MIRRNENEAASRFMLEGELKERFEDLRDIIKISQVNPLGARGTGRIGTL